MQINKDTRLSAALANAPGALAVPDVPASLVGEAAAVRGQNCNVGNDFFVFHIKMLQKHNTL